MAAGRGGAHDRLARGRRATLGALVVCEIGLASMLSISAGLLVQAFRKVLQVDPGFRPENVITFRVSLPEATYEQPEQKIAGRLRVMPGVKAAGATSAPPLGGQWGGVFEVEGGRGAGPPETRIRLCCGSPPRRATSMRSA